MTQLTPKQEAFIQEYLVDLNATQAAKRAGYKGKNLDKVGSELLGKTRVRAEIQAAMDKRAEKVGRTAEDVLRDIHAVKESCMGRGFDRDGNPTMIDAKGALKALELEGRHLKMFTDKVEIDMSDDLANRLKEARERAKNR
jgi:phage terminase small subunit